MRSPAAIAERSPERDYDALRAELAAYSEDLAKRHELVCISKADLSPTRPSARCSPRLLRARGIEPHWISAATGEGIDAAGAGAGRARSRPASEARAISRARGASW